jgi:RHS repeat-associated protein
MVKKKAENQEGFHPQPIRWKVERTIGWLAKDRGLSKDDERSTRSSESLIKIAMIHLRLRRKPGPTPAPAQPTVMPAAACGTTQKTAFLGLNSFRIASYEFQVVPATLSGPFDITLDQPVSGNLSSDGQTDRYTFTGSAGQEVVVAPPTTGPAVELRWRLATAAGTTLASGTSLLSLPVSLPADGGYRLDVTRVPNVEVTAYTLAVWQVGNQPPRPLTVDTPTPVQLDGPWDRADYAFSGTAGQWVRYTPVSGAAPGADRVDVVAVATNQVVPPLPLGPGWWRLPTTGTYRLRVFAALETPAGGWVAAGQLRLADVTPPTTAISFDQVIPATVPAGTRAEYTFTAAAGQRGFVAPEAATTAVDYYLLAPTGAVVVSGTWSNSGVRTLPVAGTYRLLVQNRDSATAALPFTLWSVPAPLTEPLPLDTVVSGALPVPGQVRQYTWTASVGSRYTFDVLQSLPPQLTWTITDPTGAIIAGPTNQEVPLVTAALAGTYTLRVGAGDGATTSAVGAYQFALRTPSALALDTPTFTGLPSGGMRPYTFTGTSGQLVFFDRLPGSGVSAQLYDPAGQLVPPTPGRRAYTLPTNGTYTLVGNYFVPPGGAAADEFVLRTVAGDLTSTGLLNAPLVGTLGAAQVQRWHVAVTAGQELLFDVLDNPAGMRFQLTDATGTTVFADTDGDQLFLPVVASSGVYTLSVEAVTRQHQPAAGTYRVRLQTVASPVLGTRDSVGTDFWLAFPHTFRDPGDLGPPPAQLSLGLSAPVDTVGVVTLPSYLHPTRIPFSITAGQVTTIPLPNPMGFLSLPQGEGITANGIRIQALAEVSVVAFDDGAAVSDAYLGLPVDALGTDYYVPTYTGGGVNLFGTGRGPEFAVVATQPNTVLTITPTITLDAQCPAGVPYTINLSVGEAYQLGRYENVDLTGTRIQSNYPVCVIAAHAAAFIPTTQGFADNILAQIPPTDTWGQRFVVTPLAGRATGGDRLRILASQANTDVRVNGVLVATLQPGQFHEHLLSSASEIVTSQPTLVMQYGQGGSLDNGNGDPVMLVVPPVEQYLADYTLSLSTSAEYTRQYLTLLVATAGVGGVRVNGTLVPATSFVSVGSSGYAVAQVAVSPGTQRVQSALPVGVQAYSWGLAIGAGYVGGLNLAPIATATSLTLAPPTSTGTPGQAVPVVATVRDAAHQPVAGVRVDFVVSGSHPAQGFAYTDAHGQAVYAVVATTTGSDVVTATQGGRSATASVSWGSTPPSVSIDTPPVGTVLPAGLRALVSGVAVAGSPLNPIASVTLNGVAAEAVDASGRFFGTVTLAAGSTVVTVQAVDTLGQVATASVTLVAPDPTTPAVDTWNDVSGGVQLTYTHTTYDHATNTVRADSTLTNTSAVPLSGYLAGVFGPFAPTTTTLADPAGTLADGRGYVRYDAALGSAGVAPGARGTPVRVGFGVPDVARFTVAVEWRMPVNTAPVWTSVPRTEAVLGQAYAFAGTAVDAEGQTLRFAVVSGPNGLHIDPVTGQVTWSPTAAQVGSHTVELVVRDERGAATGLRFPVTVVQNPTNRAPAFQSVPTTSSPVGVTYAYVPQVFDADDHSLTFSAGSGTAAGVSVDAVTGRVQLLTPAAGSYPLVVVVSDGQGGSATQAWTLTVGSAGGVALSFASPPPVVAVAGQVYAYLPRVLGGAGVPLSFSVSNPPAGLTLDAATGLVRWTPSAAQVGPVSLALHVSGGGATATQTVTLVVQPNPVNLPPVITSGAPTRATLGVPLSYPLRAVDPEGAVPTWRLVEAPAGASLSALGVLTWSPNVTGSVLFAVAADDGAGGTAEQRFIVEIRPTNTAPTFTSTPGLAVEAGGRYRYTATATDAEFDAVRFSLVNPPAGFTIDAGTGLLVGRPTTAGSVALTVRATDERGAVRDQSFTVVVTPDTTAPAVQVGLSGAGLLPGQVLTGQVLAAGEPSVTTRTLRLNGQALALDGNGQFSWLASTPGVYALVATATDAAGNVGTFTTTVRVFAPNDTTEPTITITSPSPGSVVSYLTDLVGTVSDPYLEYYTLAVARAGSNEFREIYRATTSVTNGLIGVFDPTLLESDSYTLRITAQDVNGNIARRELALELTGQAKIGNFRQEFTDLVVPVAGVPITLTRIYDTLQADRAGDFGFGWSLGMGYDPRVRETVAVTDEDRFGGLNVNGFKSGTRVYVTLPDGRRVGYRFDPVPEGAALGTLWRPRFVADPGVFDTLSVDNVPLQQRTDGTFGLYAFPFAWNPSRYTLTLTDGTNYTFDQFAGVQQIADRTGNTLNFTRDGIVSNQGPRINYVRDELGRITRITDTAGKHLNYRYDAQGNLIGAADQVGNEETYVYGLSQQPHYLTAINSICGCYASVRMDYDSNGRLITLTNALNQSVGMNYDLANFTETMTDALNRVTTLVYDARGNVTSTTDALNHTWTTTYDANDNELVKTDPDNHTTIQTYDARGNVLTMTDAGNFTTTFTYNEFSQPLTVTNPYPATVTLRYDLRGNLVEAVDPAGFVITQTLDASGRLLSRTDPLGRVMAYEYGTAQNLPTRTIYSDGTATLNDYNEFGQVLSQTDPLGHRENFVYDDAGKLLRMQDANGRWTYFGYDNRDRLLSVTDPNNNVTSYQYDDANRKTAEITANGMRTWDYNSAGELTRYLDRNGRATTFTYDLAGRQTHEYWFATTSATVPVNTIESRYDPAGNVLEMWDANSHYTFTYNSRDLVSSIDNTGTPGMPVVVMSYQYDSRGNVTQLADQSGTVVISTYDARNLLINRGWQGPQIGTVGVSFGYDGTGAMTNLGRSYNGQSAGSSTWIYDGNGRLSRLSHFNNSGTRVADYQYQYDLADRITGKKELNETANYSYDANGQLTTANYLQQPNETFAYDAAGNRIGTGVVIGSHNRLLSDGQATYQYDAEGNLIRKVVTATGEVTDYSYDHRNRMIGATVRTAGGVIVNDLSYRYDIINRRIARTVNGQTLYTSFNGEDVWADYNAAGATVARYLLGDGIDNLIARWRDSDGVAWYLTDHLGTIHDLLSDDGQSIINHLNYNAFGQMLGQSNSQSTDRFGFTGREYEAALSFYYYRARFYDAVNGRFTSQDPIGFKAGDSNWYRYANNSPANLKDPSGQATIPEWQFIQRSAAIMGRAASCLGTYVLYSSTISTIGIYFFQFGLRSQYFIRGGSSQNLPSRAMDYAGSNPMLAGMAGAGIIVTLALRNYTRPDRLQVERAILSYARYIFSGFSNVRISAGPAHATGEVFRRTLNCLHGLAR